ncbi:hypothetical protein BT93_I1133 [Corymbia citriodora subsp. variegata]|nr:hypothetical protein BT93_I1133 [Corymbia citriodora subsp. variegata]
MGESNKVFTLAEVSEHNNSKDCWLRIDGKVSSFFIFLVSFLLCVVFIHCR